MRINTVFSSFTSFYLWIYSKLCWTWWLEKWSKNARFQAFKPLLIVFASNLGSVWDRAWESRDAYTRKRLGGRIRDFPSRSSFIRVLRCGRPVNAMPIYWSDDAFPAGTFHYLHDSTFLHPAEAESFLSYFVVSPRAMHHLVIINCFFLHTYPNICNICAM